MPVTISGQRPAGEMPDATTPQPKAHIGGNHVMGFSSCAIADGAGHARTGMPDGSPALFRAVREIAESILAQLHVQTLAAQAQHFRG